MSNRSFLDFCRMIELITGPEWAAGVPAELPVYNIAGDQDPVGQYGAGVYQVSNWLTDAGVSVRTISNSSTTASFRMKRNRAVEREDYETICS